MKQHTSQQEAKESFLRMFEEMSADGQWMAVAFKPTPNGEIEFCKTTSQFPTDRFVRCLQALKDTLDREQGIYFDPEPLPLAPHVDGARIGLARPISEEDLKEAPSDNGEASFKLKIEDAPEGDISGEGEQIPPEGILGKPVVENKDIDNDEIQYGPLRMREEQTDEIDNEND